jgi:Zn-finger domain-containing protein
MKQNVFMKSFCNHCIEIDVNKFNEEFMKTKEEKCKKLYVSFI